MCSPVLSFVRNNPSSLVLESRNTLKKGYDYLIRGKVMKSVPLESKDPLRFLGRSSTLLNGAVGVKVF